MGIFQGFQLGVRPVQSIQREANLFLSIERLDALRDTQPEIVGISPFLKIHRICSVIKVKNVDITMS
jgi:hypothetical protein